MKILLALLASLLICGVHAAPAPAKPAAKKAAPRRNAVVTFYDAKFVKGGWNMADWEMVRSWRFDHDGEWVQEPKCIANKVPADATPQEMLGRRAGEVYTAMLLKKKFKGNAVISCTMEFDDRMAPGIIIAAEPVKADGKLELREHFEVILYDDGLNVWHHFFLKTDPKSKNKRALAEGMDQRWRKQSYLSEKKFYKPKTPYTLTVSVKFTGRGPQIEVACGGRVVGYYEPKMFDGEYRIGLVGCEGVNRFYDFKVTNR